MSVLDLCEVLDDLSEHIGRGDDRLGHPVEKIKKHLILRNHPLFDAHNDQYSFFRQTL